MAKSARRRAMPSTPAVQPRPKAPEPEPESRNAELSTRPDQPQAQKSGAAAARGDEPEYLIKGTGCTAGHKRGSELDGGRIGKLPTQRQARIGLGLVAWCLGGLALVAIAGVFDPRWVQFGIQIGLIWLALAAILMRRAGHKGKCWRTRTWRQAWGGLAPGGGPDPTRPAGT